MPRSRSRSDRGRRGRSRRQSRSRGRGGRSQDRGKGGRSRSRGRGGRSRDRGNDRGQPWRPAGGGYHARRAPVEAEPPKPVVTDDMRKVSIEYEGHLYASLDFFPPDDPAEIMSQKDLKLMPDGWELVPKEQGICDMVVKNHGWATNFMLFKEGEAIWTSRGNQPGKINMIWDLEKSGRLYRPSQRGALKNYYGRILIRTTEKQT
mmetsp:Transcript_57226/g.147177  ORF Transcript_57226/g.147177 Transcript_57226/m.147177 type:complete len:205 (-) Transcript_57226:63-677(-)